VFSQFHVLLCETARESMLGGNVIEGKSMVDTCGG
jgi:hypothetical protein